MISDKIDLAVIEQIARKAGAAIMEIYETEFTVEMKENKSPLTLADKVSNKIILDELKKFYPDIPFISEETRALDFEERKKWNHCWLIDPIDGTKEFIKKNGEFTVNIALTENGVPTLGVVFAPALDKMWSAKSGKGAFLQNGDDEKIKLTAQKNYLSLNTIRIVGSRSHMSPETESFIQQLRDMQKEIEFVSSGSSIKLCLVADGSADLYPRFGPTMEWDTAAGQAVAEIAGAKVFDSQTENPLRYNKQNLLNGFFIVSW